VRGGVFITYKIPVFKVSVGSGLAEEILVEKITSRLHRITSKTGLLHFLPRSLKIICFNFGKYRN
jgi:hypothetical protein